MLRTRPSTIDAIARTGLLAAVLTSLWLSADVLSGYPATATATTVLMGLATAFRLWQTRLRAAVVTHDGNGRWHIARNGARISGTLDAHRYRTAWLVIVTLRTDGGRRVRLPIWRDAVAPRDFSYLHLVLQTADPGRQPSAMAR